jgi:glycosyltransferase involved in cell wall biosynthesis
MTRLIPEKGVDLLIQELAAIPDAWSRLVVVGPRQDETFAQGLEFLISEHDLDERITLDHSRPDLTGALLQFDALVVPSTGREGQPTVIIEALAAGVPVIVRAPLARDFSGLPVIEYVGSRGLSLAIESLPVEATPIEQFAHRFGVGQVLCALDAAAAHAD